MRSSEKHNDLWCWSSQPVKTIYARFSSPETSRSRIIITPREMMDRVSRKDHRYVVLTKNDLIASKTFFKNFLPPTRGLRGNNPLSQFSSIFPCTVRGTKQPSWNSFLEETKKQPPRFFFTRSSSSLDTLLETTTALNCSTKFPLI